ncbi:MAG: hypothetical protein WB996_00640 [Ignavibacteriaceae bacterium]
MKRFIPTVIFVILIIVGFFWIKSCYTSEGGPTTTTDEQTEFSPRKDQGIQQYNLKVKKSQSTERVPCDTLNIVGYVLDNYPPGSYLVNFDKTLTYNVPNPAVIYYNKSDKKYIFGIVARSKPGERLIEPKNIVGYDQSFIDLDSTELGTAFFYLTLFQCDNGEISVVWEAPIPNHGGLNWFHMYKWAYRGTPYIRVEFHYAMGKGHLDYNYFMINGLTSPPHLLMTYKGINFKRTMANINNDQFPDYYEFIYYDNGKEIVESDSVAFLWDNKDSLYVNTRNKRQTRPY